MFFIVRCIFWLSVVYLNLPGGERVGVDAGQFLDMASAHVGSFARVRGDAPAPSLVARTAERVADTGAEWCQAHGEACADAVLAAMLAKLPPSATSSAADTLTSADKASRWRGVLSPSRGS